MAQNDSDPTDPKRPDPKKIDPDHTHSGRIDFEKARALEEEFNPEMNFRPLGRSVLWLVFAVAVALALYHYISAGFGTLPEHWHKGMHMGVVIFLIFFVYSVRKSEGGNGWDSKVWRIGNVPVYDWGLGIAALIASLYLPYNLESATFRIGNPNPWDMILGTVMIVTILEAARRTMGWVLPIIVGLFILYALFGRYVPIDFLKHPGTDWRGFISHVYLTTEGIYGVPLKVISTFVFQFVLFGVIASRMGLGQFFIEISQVIAGRYAGGPAKVSVLSSSLFGTISGSSIANTVTTGSLTIPAMKRIGYKAHFAGAVEAASSTGGQITPPIMGAAAFVMAEFLEIPYTTIIVAAAVPALMHYIGVLTIVHLEAKRLGLRGLDPAEIPPLFQVIKRGWPTVIPLIMLIWVLFSGYTPAMAAFWGITGCIVVGFLNPAHRLTFKDLVNAFYMGTKYGIVVGAAAAAVGIVVGVVTLTGTAFRVSYMVTQAALTVSETAVEITDWLPFVLFTLEQATLFFTMLFVAVACIIMGAGIPTTALYIILSAIAAPALVGQGIPMLAAHLFVLYYGVLADITPPVCTSAYAAGGIAGANPFRTGMTAFRLGNAKAMVPFVFAYQPAMLIVLEDHFTWTAFAHTTITCIFGVMLLGTALTGYLLRPIPVLSRLLMGMAAVMMVAPGMQSNLIGFALAAPVLLLEVMAVRRGDTGQTAAQARSSSLQTDPFEGK